VKCGEVPEEPLSLALTNIINLATKNPEFVPKSKIRYNRNNHGHADMGLFKTQICQYDALNRWHQLSKQLGITQWTVHGGSTMGAKCFDAMNPWDDDIDLTVLDCSPLSDLWSKSDSNISHHYPDLNPKSHSMKGYFESRLIGDGLILSKGTAICKWYKLMTVEEAYMWKPKGLIMGMDIECMNWNLSPRERTTQHRSGWSEHMRSGGDLDTVPFGPTTIQIIPPKILDRYLELRYEKKSPCRYPFGSGSEQEPFLLPFKNNTSDIFQLDQQQASLNFALDHWYVPEGQRKSWRKQAGSKKQKELTNQIPNLNKVEVDNSISPGCSWGTNSTLKVVGWNAERGTYWDKFYTLVEEQEDLKEPLVILMNEMDIGMARSGNVHTARRLALKLGMNYAFGVEFLELTRGTQSEQNRTEGLRDALSLHGNAILTKCILGDTMILRDSLPHTYFSNQAHRGINADGFEVRLGGRMGIFARIFQRSDPLILAEGYPQANRNNEYLNKLPSHFVVGNVHKVEESESNQAILWDYYAFGPPPNSTSKYEGKGANIPSSQLGVIIQGDFGPRFCPLGGLSKMNNYKTDKTFRVKCLPNGKARIQPLAGDFFCSNMKKIRPVRVTAPCEWHNNTAPLTLADHAIVSIVVEGERK